MRSLLSGVLLLVLVDFAAAEPRVIIDTDFGIPGKAFQEINAGNGTRITGRLPEGWGDNTGWKSNVVADYQPATEGARPFLRIRQTSGDGLQFTHRLPDMHKGNGYDRLTFTSRSLTGVSLAVREIGEPYTALSTFTPATDGQWRDFAHDFRLSAHRQEIGLYAITT